MPVAIKKSLSGTTPPGYPARTGQAVARILRRLVWTIASALALSAAVAALYLAKSALGVDVFAGQSPLHDLLYSFVR